MKKTNLSKVILGIVTLFAVIFYGMNVFAANNMQDLTATLGVNSNTPDNNSNTNSNTNININKDNKNIKSNSSSYDNGEIPKTGIKETIPIVLLIVVFVFSFPNKI